MTETDWIYLDNMDEMFNEKDLIPLKNRILSEKTADVFRYDRKEVTHNWTKITEEIYWPCRTARKIPNLHMDWNSYGGDEFLDHTGWIKEEPRCVKLQDFILYHFHAVFPKNIINKRRNDVNWIAPGDLWRQKIWQQIKDNDYSHIQQPHPDTVYSELPKLAMGLSQMSEYYVREELFDKTWMERTTGHVY